MSFDLDRMTAEEMCAGLMRGSAEALKLGYSWQSAAMATGDYKNVTGENYEDLCSFARGFSDGMAVTLERANPGITYERVGQSGVDRVGAYSVGYALGSKEDGFRLHPAIRKIED